MCTQITNPQRKRGARGFGSQLDPHSHAPPRLRCGLVLLLTSCGVLGFLSPLTSRAADPEKPVAKKSAAAKPQKSVDDELRKSLDDELFKDLPPASARDSKGAATQPAAGKKTPSAIDRKLLDDLSEGEDIELGQPADPLTRIGRRMRTVEQLFDQKDTSATTQEMQREIVTDLDALIKQLQQQCNKSGKSGASSQSQSKSAASTSQTTNRKPTDSTERLDKATARTDGVTQVQQLVKEVWGQMPERVREQISNVTSDQFLPQYQKMIEDYYRRLAEEAGK